MSDLSKSRKKYESLLRAWLLYMRSQLADLYLWKVYKMKQQKDFLYHLTMNNGWNCFI